MNRDNDGRYRHSDEKLCICGHANDAHSACRGRGPDGRMINPCFADDCECQRFKLAKTTTATAAN